MIDLVDRDGHGQVSSVIAGEFKSDVNFDGDKIVNA
jgi:hypothetical protein